MANNKEWQKEMIKWSKQNLIDLLEKVISEGKQKQTSDSGLDLHSVTQQRELLISFLKKYKKVNKLSIFQKGFINVFLRKRNL